MKSINSIQDLNQVLAQDKPILLDFYADWCGPCQVLLPTVEKVANDLEGKVEVRKVNVDNNQEIASDFGIRSIPALFFIKDGKIVDKAVGVVSEHELRGKLNELSTETATA